MWRQLMVDTRILVVVQLSSEEKKKRNLFAWSSPGETMAGIEKEYKNICLNWTEYAERQ